MSFASHDTDMRSPGTLPHVNARARECKGRPAGDPGLQADVLTDLGLDRYFT